MTASCQRRSRRNAVPARAAVCAASSTTKQRKATTTEATALSQKPERGWLVAGGRFVEQQPVRAFFRIARPTRVRLFLLSFKKGTKK